MSRLNLVCVWGCEGLNRIQTFFVSPIRSNRFPSGSVLLFFDC
ncbi:hypothetical protein M6B38_329150 [Iris pallida]|uniref:Uncharacterized protein n=1 Tax=Iris pallida TaxID=29817 RepID=A0AAX6H685_IRIPA|nr:hypothetical protein M6B38_329150 [Iris pallida]